MPHSFSRSLTCTAANTEKPAELLIQGESTSVFTLIFKPWKPECAPDVTIPT